MEDKDAKEEERQMMLSPIDYLTITYLPYDFIEWPVSPIEHTITINSVMYRAKEIDRKRCKIVYERYTKEVVYPYCALDYEEE